MSEWTNNNKTLVEFLVSRKGCPLLPQLFNIPLKILANSRHNKRYKDYNSWKRGDKFSVFAHCLPRKIVRFHWKINRTFNMT